MGAPMGRHILLLWSLLVLHFGLLSVSALPTDKARSSPTIQSLSQRLNHTSRIIGSCVANQDWLGGGLYDDDCYHLVTAFYAKIHHQQDYVYDFLGPGVEPTTHLPTWIRTPVKYSYGTFIQAYTLSDYPSA